jgi:hypothetical protein
VRARFALPAIVMIGAVLRFTDLGARSLWQDEIGTVVRWRSGLGSWFGALRDHDDIPPLWDVVGWPWTHLAGHGEASVRFPSAVIGVLTIVVAYAAARRLAGERAGLAAAALAAFSPMLVWHAQDARPYALLALLGGLSFLTWLRARDDPRPGPLALWAAVSIAAVATHYFAAFTVGVEALLLLRSAPRRAVVTAIAAIAAAGLALAPLALAQRGHSSTFVAFIGGTPLIQRIAELPAQDLVGYQPPAQIALSVLAALLAAVALAGLIRTREVLRSIGPAAAVGAGTTGLTIAAALVGVDYVYTRNLAAAWVPVNVVLAAGFAATRAARVALVALCGLGAAIVIATAHDPKFEHDDWRGLARAIGTPVAGGRAIVATPSAAQRGLGYYRPASRLVTSPGSLRVAEIDAVALPGPFRRIGEKPRPPRPASPPPPPGFVIVQRRTAGTYTLVRYRTRSGRPLPVDRLIGLSLDPGRDAIVLAEP